MIVVRIVFALLAASAYQLATNVFLHAALLVFNGHWKLAAVELLAWFVFNALAVMLSKLRVSKLTGLPILTAPDWLFVLGNEQDGYTSQRAMTAHQNWPWWLVAFVECAWRNRLRNLPFCRPVAWLHKPLGKMDIDQADLFDVELTVFRRRWMVELQWNHPRSRRFGDFGPRLDQPAQWGAVSWAFRPFGRY